MPVNLSSVPAYAVADVIGLVLLAVTLVVEAAAFVHCVTRKPEAFLAVGNVPKAGWVAMTGAALLFSALFLATAFTLSILSILGVMALVVALVYLLDVRPALRDAVDGRGSW